MAINNPRYFNAAIAGIGGAAKSAWLNDTTAADYLAYTNAVNAAATAVDTAIGAVSGGASQSAADLLSSICFAVFLNRNVSSTTSTDYTVVANSIAALFAELLLKETAQPGNTASVLSVSVPSITAPNTAQVTITNALYIGANTISAEFSGPPTNTQLELGGAWVSNTTTGAIVISFNKIAGNYTGATELVRVAVSS